VKPVCLVIGAGAGIGGTVARRFAREGYHAVLCRRSDADGLNTLVDAITGDGGAATGFLLNAIEANAIEERVATVEADIGPIEVAVYNLGAQIGDRALKDTSPKAFETGWRLGTFGLFRLAAAVEVCASPLLVTAPDEQALAQRIRNVRARISFYASTRTYRAVFEHHGWGDLVPELSVLSRQQRWEEMPQQITDEMLETIAIVGTYDQITERVWQRYEGVATRVEFNIPVRNDTDRGQLREMIQDLRRAG